MKPINRFTVASLTTLVGVAGATQLTGCKEAPQATAPAAAVVTAPATSALAAAPSEAAAATANKAALYAVVEGYKVDTMTMEGFRTWRAAACDRCHGANQEGMVGPSLIAALKTLNKEEFVKVVRDGRLDKGMQSFGNSKQVMDNMDNLWAYLKGRSDGAITRAKVEENK